MNPNAIEAIRKLNRAVGLLSRRDPGDEGRAMRLTKEIDALLAAAEKPAEKPPAPPPIATPMTAPKHVAVTLNEGGSGERYGVRINGMFRIDCTTRDEADRIADALNRAEKPAEAAPVAPLPWVVRDAHNGAVVAMFAHHNHAIDLAGDKGLFEVAAAPTVAAVKFEGGRAGGSEWLAATHSEEPFRFVTVRLDLRPGEDAGETVAKMLAPVGRGP